MNKAKLSRGVAMTVTGVVYFFAVFLIGGFPGQAFYFLASVLMLVGLAGTGLAIGWAVQHVNDYEDHS